MKLPEQIFDPEAREIIRVALDALGQYAVGCGVAAENVFNLHRESLSTDEQQTYEAILQDLRRQAVAAGMLRFQIAERTKQIAESN